MIQNESFGSREASPRWLRWWSRNDTSWVIRIHTKVDGNQRRAIRGSELSEMDGVVQLGMPWTYKLNYGSYDMVTLENVHIGEFFDASKTGNTSTSSRTISGFDQHRLKIESSEPSKLMNGDVQANRSYGRGPVLNKIIGEYGMDRCRWPEIAISHGYSWNGTSMYSLKKRKSRNGCRSSHPLKECRKFRFDQ
jgi:hypothetical protein